MFGYDTGLGAEIESELSSGSKLSITAYVNGQGQIHAMSISPVQPEPGTGFGPLKKSIGFAKEKTEDALSI